MGLAGYRRSISETKRAAILKAARENFLTGGYSGAAMAQIAREADVSTATLYKHFASKDALFSAVVQAAYTGSDLAIMTDIDGLSARAVVERLVGAYVLQQFDGRMNDLLRVVIAEVPSAPELAQDVFENSVTARYLQFRKVVDALVARGDLKPHDTEAGVRYLGGMVKEFVVWPALFKRNFRKPDDLDEKTSACVDAYLKIYEA